MRINPFPLLAGLGLVLGLAGTPAFADDDLDAATRAKVAKERTKKARDEQKDDRDSSLEGATSNPNDCGRIDIGNFFAGNKPVRGSPEITVLITGDVISANNHCR